MEMMLQTQNLCKYFRKQKAVNNVSLNIEKGQIYGLLGPNGAGKSTTLKMLTGMMKPTAGKIYFDGKLLDRKDLSKIGALIENPPIYENLSARENLKVRQLLLGTDENRIDEVLQIVSLTNTGKKKAGQFSLGMKQRLGIAMALLGEPELLILDEGQIIAKGDTRELFENPKKVEVARLTGCKNISKIEIIDDYHLKSLDWGCIFEVSEKISPNITHIGIRAHDFVAAEKDDVNSIDTSNSKKLEMPFEWRITLSNGLWWIYEKRIHDHDFEIPDYLKVDPKNIILLEE